MKTFRRIFLTISGILAVLGVVMISIGFSKGGAELASSDLLNNHLSIDLKNMFSVKDEEIANMTDMLANDNGFPAEEVKNFELKGNAGEFELSLGDTSDYRVQVISGTEFVKFSLKDGTLIIASEEQKLVNWGNDVKVKIYIPKDVVPEKMILNIGAGELVCNGIKTNDLDVNIGAGEGIFNNIEATKSQFNVGAGDGEINNALLGECDLRVGIGDLDVSGNVSSNLNVDCGVGNIDLDLANMYEDFNYTIKVGAGDVELGREKYAGISNAMNLNNNADKTMNIKCGLGDVSVEFAY